jgi:AcrR family transcriptional regulator
MVAHSRTADQILSTFLRLVAERGLDATTTRTLAEEAGVNEVTIFRHFGDKATLAREAVRRFQPASRIAAYPLAIDATSPDRAAAGLLACLRFLRDSLREHPELLQFGLSEYWRFPELSEDVAAAPRAARALLERALAQAAPVLRPEVDRQATTLGLLGLILLTVIWQSRGWLTLTDEAWDVTLAAALRPLLREEG